VALRHGWVYTASTRVETDLPELVRLRQSYDLIVGWHVLEHLIHPDATLRQLARLLAPTGCLALSLPCAGTVWARLFGASWYDWQVPWHQWHFTRALLRWELELAGFEVQHCWGQRTLKSLAGSTQRPWLGRILGHWLVSYLGGCLLNLIGQNPRMTVVATHETGSPASWLRARAGGVTEQEWKA
jgi:SAM-dependent methyltransferase